MISIKLGITARFISPLLIVNSDKEIENKHNIYLEMKFQFIGINYYRDIHQHT